MKTAARKPAGVSPAKPAAHNAEAEKEEWDALSDGAASDGESLDSGDEQDKAIVARTYRTPDGVATSAVQIAVGAKARQAPDYAGVMKQRAAEELARATGTVESAPQAREVIPAAALQLFSKPAPRAVPSIFDTPTYPTTRSTVPRGEYAGAAAIQADRERAEPGPPNPKRSTSWKAPTPEKKKQEDTTVDSAAPFITQAPAVAEASALEAEAEADVAALTELDAKAAATRREFDALMDLLGGEKEPRRKAYQMDDDDEDELGILRPGSASVLAQLADADEVGMPRKARVASPVEEKSGGSRSTSHVDVMAAVDLSEPLPLHDPTTVLKDYVDVPRGLGQGGDVDEAAFNAPSRPGARFKTAALQAEYDARVDDLARKLRAGGHDVDPDVPVVDETVLRATRPALVRQQEEQRVADDAAFYSAVRGLEALVESRSFARRVNKLLEAHRVDFQRTVAQRKQGEYLHTEFTAFEEFTATLEPVVVKHLAQAAGHRDESEFDATAFFQRVFDEDDEAAQLAEAAAARRAKLQRGASTAAEDDAMVAALAKDSVLPTVHSAAVGSIGDLDRPSLLSSDAWELVLSLMQFESYTELMDSYVFAFNQAAGRNPTPSPSAEPAPAPGQVPAPVSAPETPSRPAVPQTQAQQATAPTPSPPRNPPGPQGGGLAVRALGDVTNNANIAVGTAALFRRVTPPTEAFARPTRVTPGQTTAAPSSAGRAPGRASGVGAPALSMSASASLPNRAESAELAPRQPLGQSQLRAPLGSVAVAGAAGARLSRSGSTSTGAPAGTTTRSGIRGVVRPAPGGLRPLKK